MDYILQGFNALTPQFDYITVEGSGGILCPIDYDRTGQRSPIFLEDIIRAMNLNSVIVADAGLGTINAVVLTAEYMASHNLPVRGIIFNRYHKGNIMEEDNLYMCEKMTGLPVLACVQNGDTDIEIDDDILKGLYK